MILQMDAENTIDCKFQQRQISGDNGNKKDTDDINVICA